MPLNLKISWGEGSSSARLMGLDDGTTFGDLKALVASKSGISAERLSLKAGFPPKEVSGSDSDAVVQLGVVSGSAFTALERKSSSSPPAHAPPVERSAFSGAASLESSTTPAPAPALASAPAAASLEEQPTDRPASGSVQSLVDMGFPAEYAEKALEAAGGDFHTALEMCMGGDPAAFISDGDQEVATQHTATPSTAPKKMVRRIIDADNSCLFNAVGYGLRRKRKVGVELRQMITEAVRGSPEVYNEGILGKKPEEYCKWISDSKSWGGEIELSILSKKLAVMITVVDIQTNNAYSYGQELGFDRRIFLIYDGAHYDALAKASAETSPEADDVTVFDPNDNEKVDMAKVVAADLKARNQYTNMGSASLKCMVCLKLLEGEQGAMEHARATTHQNFGQI